MPSSFAPGEEWQVIRRARTRLSRLAFVPVAVAFLLRSRLAFQDVANVLLALAQFGLYDVASAFQFVNASATLGKTIIENQVGARDTMRPSYA
jgi:hypothetical protein